MEIVIDDVILVLAALLTSTISGVIGMAGGILLLAIMAVFFPPAVLIPMHGLVQLASNAFRTGLHWANVNQRLLWAFAGGVILGALAGSRVVVSLPEQTFRLILGTFILTMTWMPKFKSAPEIPGKFFALGGVASFCSLFIGATGPLIAPFFLRENLDKRGLIATKAACQTVIHFAKIIAFIYIGFELSEYLWLIVAMMAMTFLGNYLGKLLLNKIPEKTFKWIFRVIITVLAVRMLLLATVS